MPMVDIVSFLPIENELKAALCKEPNNEYLPLLRLVQCLEEATWTESEEMIRQLDLDGKKVRAAFQASIDWANNLSALHPAHSAGAG